MCCFKKYLLFFLSLSAFASGSKQPVPRDTTYQIQGLTDQKQEKQLWCAAAATRMMLSQVGSPPRQCTIVGRVIGEDCCNRLSVKCTKEIEVERGLRAMGYNYGYTRSPTFQKVVNLIKSGKPVAIYHEQGSSDVGHAVVAYWAYNNDKNIAVYDPLSDSVKFWDASYVTGLLRWYRLVWKE